MEERNLKVHTTDFEEIITLQGLKHLFKSLNFSEFLLEEKFEILNRKNSEKLRNENASKKRNFYE